MKSFAALTLCLASFAVFGADQAASDASVRQLLEVTQTRKLMDGMFGQMDTMMQNSMKQATGERTFTPEQQAIMDEMQTKLIGLIRDEMRWDVLEPELLEIYRTSFTEEEVLGMLEFYRSSAGQAMITKMPVVMQQSMEMSQRHVGNLMPRFKELQDETVEQLKACCKDGAK